MKKLFISKLLLSVSVLLLLPVSDIISASDTLPTTSISTKSTEWQNTPPYNNPGGAIDMNQYTQAELDILSPIAGGDDEYIGNSYLKNVATDHVYASGKVPNVNPYPNFVGNDGILKLYNQSEFIPDPQVKSAIKFINTLARKEIVRLVADKKDSNETIHDVPNVQKGALAA